MNRPEILSPCGDYNCFISAVNAGCDAVYLSGNRYGARAYADNFSDEQLLSAIDYAHLFSVKVYLTVNTLTKNDELNDLYDYLLPLYEAGLDGVIVQDIGVISYIRRCLPLLPVHASTQMAITSSEGVDLLKSLGVTRVVLAREVSLNEINNIYKNTGMEIECFVHGALCYSYSGKCLFSSLVGGRSGNRGRCAGPCRQPYNNNQYILSTKDICCLKIMPELIEAGVVSFKIEGRMKNPEYVAGVTGIYKKHLNRYFDLREKYDVNEAIAKYKEDALLQKDFDTLVDLYTRGGNSEGYYFKNNGRDMISINNASYQTGDEELKKSIISEYLFNKKIAINYFISIHPEAEAELCVYNDNFSVNVKGTFVQKSENRPLTLEDVTKQLKKLGNTPFEVENIEYDIMENSFMRIKELNDLRREGIKAFMEEMLSSYRREIPNYPLRGIDNGAVRRKLYSSQKTISDILTFEQLKASLECNEIYGVYVPFSLISRFGLEMVANLFREYEKKLYVKFPSVIRNDFFNTYSCLIENIINTCDGMVVDNYECIQYLMRKDYKGEIVGDIHIYSMNNEALVKYKALGLSRVTIPVELNKKEIYSMDFEGQELIIYGRLPMMVSAQCINKTLNGCNKTENSLIIKDRKNAEFVSFNDCVICTNTIYNSAVISLHGEKDFISKVNPEYLRLIFTDEDYKKTKKIVEDYTRNAIDDNQYDIKNFTRGHLNRGVL